MNPAKQTIQAIIFDYGGTLDTHGVHWSEKFWDAYLAADVPIQKADYEKAYVYAGDKKMSKLIKPAFGLRKTLETQIGLQLDFLESVGCLSVHGDHYLDKITNLVYTDVQDTLARSAELLENLAQERPLALVSNYYGNIAFILKEQCLAQYFKVVIDSAVVGVRKPNPAIFAIGISALEVFAGDVLVVGDSFERDIIPAKQCGCQTAWIKGRSWREESGGPEADHILFDINSLKKIV
jgi:putative hydrolase of the HAD superfamily